MKKFGLLSYLIASSVWAANLSAPLNWENASVLPVGVGQFQYKNSVSQMNSNYNENGATDSIGQKFEKNITWNDLVNSQKGTDKVKLQGFVQAMEIDNQSLGKTTGEVAIDANIKVPVLSFGASEKLTLALVVPYYDVKVDAKTGFAANEEAQENFDKLSAPQQQKINDGLKNPVQSLVTSMGYEPIDNERINGIGDIKIVPKYQFYSSGVNTIAFKGDFTLPTGERPNVNKVIDFSTGDGQYDVGGLFVWDQNYSVEKYVKNVRITTYGGYVAQLSDELDRRVPQGSGESLSPDVERVKRDLGDKTQVGTSLLFGKSSNGFSIGVGYDYQFRSQTKYSGVKFEEDRYNYLSDLSPEQELSSALVHLNFATIDWYKESAFFYPLEVSLMVAHPLNVKNLIVNDTYTAQLVLYF